MRALDLTIRYLMLSAVLDSLEGDSELLREIAGIFLAQFPKHMEKIREAVVKSRSETSRTRGARAEGHSGKLAGAGSRGSGFQIGGNREGRLRRRVRGGSWIAGRRAWETSIGIGRVREGIREILMVIRFTRRAGSSGNIRRKCRLGSHGNQHLHDVDQLFRL